jgi:prepilin-type N-terminal cleavage/methylation domain-containing protein
LQFAQHQDGRLQRRLRSCAQSSHYATGLEREELLPVDDILSAAHRARAEGATRFCMGAAWRSVRDGTPKFEQVLETVREVSRLGMEVCVTLGQIGPTEARKLKAAGVTAYNHNIDTSPEFYPEIVSTHTFADRLNTIAAVQEFAGTMRSKPAAFSLLELVIAIVILAILATLLLPVHGNGNLIVFADGSISDLKTIAASPGPK